MEDFTGEIHMHGNVVINEFMQVYAKPAAPAVWSERFFIKETNRDLPDLHRMRDTKQPTSF